MAKRRLLRHSGLSFTCGSPRLTSVNKGSRKLKKHPPLNQTKNIWKMGGPKALAAATSSPRKFSVQVAPSKFLVDFLWASSPSKFSQQVALSKLLARVPLRKFSKQDLSASCSEQVVGASSSEKALQARSLSKLLWASCWREFL